MTDNTAVPKAVSASLVLYNNPEAQFSHCIQSFLNSSPAGRLIVVDNSPTPLVSSYFGLERVTLIKPGKNIGFGRGHNLALQSVTSDIHFLLNPDIEFDPHVIPELVKAFSENKDIGAIMPRIVYPDGTDQFLCKLLPTPMDLIGRRFLPNALAKHFSSNYVLKNLPTEGIIEVPTLSGCFLGVQTALLRSVGGFDPRYFMYLEDVDLVRRIGRTHETVYCANVTAIHQYAKGSYRSAKLLRYHIASAVKYFFKFGWFYDPERRAKNSKAQKYA